MTQCPTCAGYKTVVLTLQDDSVFEETCPYCYGAGMVSDSPRPLPVPRGSPITDQWTKDQLEAFDRVVDYKGRKLPHSTFEGVFGRCSSCQDPALVLTGCADCPDTPVLYGQVLINPWDFEIGPPEKGKPTGGS